MANLRDPAIDMTRGMAMLLVIFAHNLLIFFWHRPDGQFDTVAFEVAQFIYSFHMPAFYFISGMTALNLKDRPFSQTAIQSLTLTLILFAFVTHLLSVPVIELLQGVHTLADNIRLIIRPLIYGTGFPLILPWFLISLALVQCLAWLYLRANVAIKIALALGLLLIYLLNQSDLPVFFMSSTWGVGLAFFLAGRHFAAHPRPELGAWAALFLGAIAMFAVAFLYPLNKGCFLNPVGVCNTSGFPAFGVNVVGGHVGFLPLFGLTALSAIAGLLLLSEGLKATFLTPVLTWLGRNTLCLLILNGLCLVLLNPVLAAHLPSQSWFAGSLIVMLLHIAILPVVAPVFNWLQSRCRIASAAIYGGVSSGAHVVIRRALRSSTAAE